MISPPVNEEQLEEALSRPTKGVLETIDALPGDFMVLGVGGKMGPSLSRMVRRALDQLGRRDTVTGVARFSDSSLVPRLQEVGVHPVACDLLQRDQVKALPEASNVIFMAGQKFGTASSPDTTWAMNTLVPSHVAERFAGARIAVFSTGCVYPLVPVVSGGCREDAPLGPPGDYANSCVGRERIFTYYSRLNSTPMAIIRLNYAIDLRYGVLLDVAQRASSGEAVDVSMGHVNVIWQGDANAQAIQSLSHAASPPFIINVTGPEIVSVRALAHQFGRLFDRQPVITGEEGATAWLGHAGKAHQMFGYPSVPLDQMVQWVASWVEQGGSTLGKPTHFETRSGQF